MPGQAAEEFGPGSPVPAKGVQATSQSAGDAAFADEAGKVQPGPLEQFLSRRQQIQIHVLCAIINT